MPFFLNKFAPKKAPLRKSNNNVSNDELLELVTGHRQVHLRLGNQDLVFQNGQWIPENGEGGSIHRLNQKLKKKVQDLQEENNMLKLKYTIMLNMLTQSTAENHINDKELERLKNKT